MSRTVSEFLVKDHYREIPEKQVHQGREEEKQDVIQLKRAILLGMTPCCAPQPRLERGTL